MTATAATSTGRLTVTQGTALYVGAVLGTGVIALPALAAQVAGPASLLAWLALVLLSVPLAGTFAALGSRYPDAGGVATYARLAFGDRAAAMVGWWFFLAVPVGGGAAALFGGAYVASALGGGSTRTAIAAFVLMVIVGVTNAFGVHLTGRVQLNLAGVLVAFLLSAVLLSARHATWSNLHPFTPHGWLAVGPAAALLVWSFVGWEAVAHLAAEFRHPERDLPRAVAAAVLVVGGLYLALAAATILVLGATAADSAAPLGDLLASGLGGRARVLAAIVAVLLTLGAMNAYFAGGAKLGAALGRDGALPTWLARGSLAGQVPRRSLAIQLLMAFAVLAVVIAAGSGAKPLVLLTTALFVAVYAVGVAAAVRLLPRRGPAHGAALIALAAVLVLLVMTGVYLLWPVLVALAALLYLRLAPRRGDRMPTNPGGAS